MKPARGWLDFALISAFRLCRIGFVLTAAYGLYVNHSLR